jgi:SAM-dependent methyltransferase
MDHSLDDPATTMRRAELIQKKSFLKAFYEDAYDFFRCAMGGEQNSLKGKRLEIGSGAGFLKKVIPDVITSEYLDIPTVDIPKCSALDLPFERGELSVIFLLDVLHHIPDLDAFFDEAIRVLQPGGVVALVEPANTLFARFVYQHFHHEAFDPSAYDWKLPPGGGPLSAANGALPWIALVRDRKRFEERFSKLRIELLEPFGPLLYPLSGGVGRVNQFLPGRCLPGVRAIERLLSPLNKWVGFFYRIILRRRD